MNVKATLLILLVVLAVTCCLGQSNSQKLSIREPQSSKDITKGLGIYRGRPTTIEKHPYIATFTVDGFVFFAGTIVSDSWIVTTADYVTYYNQSQMNVVVGSNDGSSGTPYKIQSIVIHPKYGNISFDHDYACVQIIGKFKWSKKVQPIKLATRSPRGNTWMTVAGYGNTEMEKHQANSNLREGNMKWLSKKGCEKAFAIGHLNFTDSMACAYNKGKTTLCTGDQGDPFVYNGALYGYFLGSFPNDWCTHRAYPGILADTTAAFAWIKRITGAQYAHQGII